MKRNEFVTADYHFGHRAIIQYSERPFVTVPEMDEALIGAWNRKVPIGATVYFIGDFSFHKQDKTREIRSRLNGTIRHIRGNHDRLKRALYEEMFEWVRDYYESKTEDGIKVIMSHYPFLTWNGSHHNSWSLHGHCHGSLQRTEDLVAEALRVAGFKDAALFVENKFKVHPRRLDVGVDTHPEYEPYSFEEILEKMAGRGRQVIDHHGMRE